MVAIMLSCFDIADYFLNRADPEVGDLISNLKLQKLVYYAQGLHLALYDAPLFPEPIEAWMHGPVVPVLYHKYKEYKSEAIPRVERVENLHRFTQEQVELLDDIYELYGQFSAWKLRNMTHEEAPWKETELNCVIPQELMKEFFKSRIN
jgi:uncharacterized phage-associated protein